MGQAARVGWAAQRLLHALGDGTMELFAPKIDRVGFTGQICGSHRLDRCGQCPQNTIWTSSLNRYRRVDQDSYVECLNHSPDEGVTISTDLHAGCTGLPVPMTDLTGAP
jgi:hypothetical protein